MTHIVTSALAHHKVGAQENSSSARALEKSREERLAAALRENLRKRRGQLRARAYQTLHADAVSER